MGEESRKKAEGMGWQHVAESYIKIINELKG
jgi:hypothetical protein